MKPYYDEGGITIYHGDCLSILPDLVSKSVDLFVTDPPYGTRTNLRDGWMVGEFSNVIPLVLPELYRVGVEDAGLYSFTSWTWMADWIMRASPYFRMQSFIIWDKERHSGCYGKYSWQFHWEGIYYGIKGPRKIREYYPDVLRSKERGKRLPMQKPVDIFACLIRASSDPLHVILDPFMGSGSSLLASRREGRRAIGIEIEEKYCEIAAKRLRQEVLPLSV